MLTPKRISKHLAVTRYKSSPFDSQSPRRTELGFKPVACFTGRYVAAKVTAKSSIPVTIKTVESLGVVANSKLE